MPANHVCTLVGGSGFSPRRPTIPVAATHSPSRTKDSAIMDPVTALSVVSAVVTFLDFGDKLINQAFEIARSANGQPEAAASLLESTQELTSIATEAQTKVKHLVSKHPRHAQLIERLRIECETVEKQLEEKLETLTVEASSRGLLRLGSVAKVSIRSLWSRKAVEEWRTKISWIRDQAMMSVLMCLWYLLGANARSLPRYPSTRRKTDH